ncbi:membrane protein [Paenibacillus swuensis]|uniref:Membrane protein n=1 Tax=Paenibacillus swuensis TaxID=1178515 RepID=A0A172TJD5_9BACL|nr:DUF4321 domain-containing protein [Paenibacillus swuensis]ANE47165.1 membrane protein [Paenibacillus swuensis]
MKKNTLTLIIFILLGLLLGSIAAHVLSGVKQLSFLTESTMISWQPRANLDVISYDLKLQVKLSVMSILGLVASIWIYRKL